MNSTAASDLKAASTGSRQRFDTRLDKLDVALNAAARLPAQRSAFGLGTSQPASADFLC